MIPRPPPRPRAPAPARPQVRCEQGWLTEFDGDGSCNCVDLDLCFTKELCSRDRSAQLQDEYYCARGDLEVHKQLKQLKRQTRSGVWESTDKYKLFGRQEFVVPAGSVFRAKPLVKFRTEVRMEDGSHRSFAALQNPSGYVNGYVLLCKHEANDWSATPLSGSPLVEAAGGGRRATRAATGSGFLQRLVDGQIPWRKVRCLMLLAVVFIILVIKLAGGCLAYVKRYDGDGVECNATLAELEARLGRTRNASDCLLAKDRMHHYECAF
eukprot:SAG22_NODE_142_length_17922_cov_10.990406_20_plen_267_part_00